MEINFCNEKLLYKLKKNQFNILSQKHTDLNSQKKNIFYQNLMKSLVVFFSYIQKSLLEIFFLFGYLSEF